MRALVLAALVLLSACAGMSRMMTYPQTLADARVRVGHREYSIWFHRTEPTIVVQRGLGAATGQGVIEGVTFNTVDMQEPAPVWRAAAETVLTPLHCRVVEIYSLDNDMTWEARYACDDAQIVSQATVQANRPTWRQGLATPDPMRR